MADPVELSDEELLDEIAATDDPQDLILLRALAAQRGLHSGGANMDPKERARRQEEGPVL